MNRFRSRGWLSNGWAVRVTSGLRNAPAAFPILAALLLLGGCATVQVHLGMKVSLAKTPIASIKAAMPKGPGIAPGQKAPLVVTVAEPNGKVLQTEGAGHGKVLWKDLQVTASVVKANQKGIISLAHDPRVSDGKDPQVTITVPSPSGHAHRT